MPLTQDQFNTLTQRQLDNYNTNRLDMVEIDGTPIVSYSTFSYYEAKTYVTSPTRSQAGALGNINSLATFITPRLKISFKYMKIDTYRILMRIINGSNEFTVTCYDPVSNTRKTNLMYFSPVDYPEIYQQKLEVLGLFNYEIELIGTNNEVSNVLVSYNANVPLGAVVSNMPTNKTIAKNTNTIIGSSTIPTRDGFRFVKWGTNANGTGFCFTNNKEYLIYQNETLYAIWEATDNG